MVFNEREAIRFRMEQIAVEKEKLFQRDKVLDKEYKFYIERLRDLDQNSSESLSNHSQETQRTYNGDLKSYDFDALKKGLSHVKTRLPEEVGESKVHDSLPAMRSARGRRGKQYNLKEVATIVEDILIDNGAPMEIRKLRRLLDEKGFAWKHFWPTLSNIMKHSGHINKPSRGMITYVPEGSEASEASEDPETSEAIPTASTENTADLTGITSGLYEAASAEDVPEEEDESNDVKAAADEIPNSVFGDQDDE